MKTITIVYEILDPEEFKKVDLFKLEHNGLKSFAAGVGNAFDYVEALEDQLINEDIAPNKHQ